MKFDGKVVLVTGSTTGIGEACARGFAEAGASIMLAGRNAMRGKLVLEAIKALGRDADLVIGNITDDGFCDRLVEKTVSRFGRLDVLINNAGVLHAGDVTDTTDEVLDETIGINVTALFRMSRAAVRQMRKQGSGNIVNIASEWGLNGEAGYVAYCASKGAVVQITRCMGLDHAAENIRVNSVCPGEVHTVMVDEMLKESGSTPAQLAAGIPMRRLAKPTEIANCVMFLASDLASYVTGTSLSVDGGNDATAGAYPPS